jgi:hypothetical protein
MKRTLIGYAVCIFCWISLQCCTKRPRATYIYCGADSSKTLTIFHLESIFGNSDTVYIIPGRYSGPDTPHENYVKIAPRFDQSLNVNWQPRDGHIMYIQLAWCDQPFEDHLDTAKYRFFRGCGQHEYYMDAHDSFYYPKYGSYGWFQWAK